MIHKAKKKHINETAECLNDSLLFDNYWNEKDSCKSFVKESIRAKELYIYTDNSKNILGLMRIDLKGMFSVFPLLRLLSIKAGYRNTGIGTKLLKYFEKICFQ